MKSTAISNQAALLNSDPVYIYQVRRTRYLVPGTGMIYSYEVRVPGNKNISLCEMKKLTRDLRNEENHEEKIDHPNQSDKQDEDKGRVKISVGWSLPTCRRAGLALADINNRSVSTYSS